MAMLHTQYRLCSGLNAQNVIGIQEDLFPENVIATLGSNIAIVYKLSDQQVIRSWPTRQSLRFTAPVVVDPSTQQYIGVFGNKLCRWDLDELDISKCSKQVFSSDIHSVHVAKECGTYVVFQNGYVQLLDEAVNSRREEKISMISPEETIDNVLLHSSTGSAIIVLVTKQGEITRIYVLHRKGNSEVTKIRHFTCSRKTRQKRLGMCLSPEKDTISLISLWEDGKLLKRDCMQEAPDSEEMGETLHALTGISLQSMATLLPIGKDHLAVCGAHPDNEGSFLLIWNAKFGLPLAGRKLKLVLNTKKVWSIHNNVLIVIGQQLMVIPMTIEDSRLLSVIGSAITKAVDCKTVAWKGTEVSEVRESNDSSIAKKAKVLLSSNGFTDYVVCKEVLVKLQEERDLLSLHECMKCLNLVSEDTVLSVLQFYLGLDFELVKNQQNKFKDEIGDWESSYPNLDNVKPTKESRSELKILKDCLRDNAPNPYTSLQSVLVNQVLRTRISPHIMVRYLKRLEYECGVNLLRYLLHLLSYSLPSAPSVSCLITWMTMLLDAFFNELVLTKNTSIHEMLIHLSEAINFQMDLCDDMDQLEVLLKRLSTKAPNQLHEGNYCIELLKLY